jgi:hypothetical protein
MKVGSNWKHCGCTHLERSSGNGCLQCNPEFAYDIAKRLVEKIEMFNEFISKEKRDEEES